ncbi:hypothetical protein NPX13_g10356 [Xylaria arbuscula]|uniref:Uncharacterized protein n=1 Tax=Xylaria arbuscula TaxID=114810 RepID=A0A9W8TGN5_9PEZI|nr:hypothetical protein NPX13_g10356 [Xylaria arbuscula]
MSRLHPNGGPAPRPVSWSCIPADDPAAHEQMIKFISESLVDDIQSNISSGFMRQVHASKKSAMSPHDKAERMRIVRAMRTTLERLTEELGQKFFEEFRHRPSVGRWYDSWLFNETPQFWNTEPEWSMPSEPHVAAVAALDTRSVTSSNNGRVFGSETTPEVRVDFTEDVEEFEAEDTQDFAQVPYDPNAAATEKQWQRCGEVDVDARSKRRAPRQLLSRVVNVNIMTTKPSMPHISARLVLVATRVTAASHPVAVTRHARTTSTTLP